MLIILCRLRHKKKHDEQHAGLGFHNIIYADFSCDKYPAISQTYCENHSTQPANHFHEYSCTECQKSFPIGSALDLHVNQHHYTPSKFICTLCNHDYTTKTQLDTHKQAFATRKHLTDPKRKFIRALSLIPKCAEQSMLSQGRQKRPPPIDYGYYEKLDRVDQVTQMFYKSEPIIDHEDSESSQSSWELRFRIVQCRCINYNFRVYRQKLLDPKYPVKSSCRYRKIILCTYSVHHLAKLTPHLKMMEQ